MEYCMFIKRYENEEVGAKYDYYSSATMRHIVSNIASERSLFRYTVCGFRKNTASQPAHRAQ